MLYPPELRARLPIGGRRQANFRRTGSGANAGGTRAWIGRVGSRALEQGPSFAAVAGVRPVALAARADDERQIVAGRAADDLELVRLARRDSIRERVLAGTP